jgi:hypothetical protein
VLGNHQLPGSTTATVEKPALFVIAHFAVGWIEEDEVACDRESSMRRGRHIALTTRLVFDFQSV